MAIKTKDPRIRIHIDLNCWIRIRIETMRMHNIEINQFRL